MAHEKQYAVESTTFLSKACINNLYHILKIC